jgi:hypothetical protein
MQINSQSAVCNLQTNSCRYLCPSINQKHFIMAKQNSLVRIEGTIDNLTFYKNANGHFVRSKGGVSKNRIMNDPAFVRTRENGVEFSSIAGSGKLLRTALGSMLFSAKDSGLTSRLVKVMAQVKNMDSTSVRGERNVAVGLMDPAGRALLAGFDFNGRTSLSTVLNASLAVDMATGAISITPFNPMEQMQSVRAATHFSMQSGFLDLDFETGVFDLTQSPKLAFPLVSAVVAPVLTPTAVPAGSGTRMVVLLIEFFQEVNGVQYMLNNGALNVLRLVAVE